MGLSRVPVKEEPGRGEATCRAQLGTAASLAWALQPGSGTALLARPQGSVVASRGRSPALSVDPRQPFCHGFPDPLSAVGGLQGASQPREPALGILQLHKRAEAWLEVRRVPATVLCHAGSSPKGIPWWPFCSGIASTSPGDAAAWASPSHGVVPVWSQPGCIPPRQPVIPRASRGRCHPGC